MDKVASLPCMLSVKMGSPVPSECLHHVREGQGLSQRASHFLTIPLTNDAHTGDGGFHRDKTLWKIAKTNELELLAMTLEMMQTRFMR